MQQYSVTGMSCAACSARVEKAVSAVEGVTSCSVSLLTNSMGVSGTASSQDIVKAVVDAGYGATLKSNDKIKSNTSNDMYDRSSLEDVETPKLIKRLVASIILMLPLMYVSMGHMMFHWPLPRFLDGNHVAMGLYELLLAGFIMVINQRFFISGFKGLMHKAPNMDTLVALGSMASFVYSVYALFAMTGAVLDGNHANVMRYMDEFYFESAAMILTLITVGKTLEARSKGKTTNALKGLMDLAPKTAIILRDDIEIEIPLTQVKVGDIFVVRSGYSIPVDGVVIEGNGAVNEAAITGESIPVDKVAGDEVTAATISEQGYMVCEATRVGEDTTLSKIIQMVSDAAATKAPIAKIADRVSGIFVPAVISIAAITFIIWMLVGQNFGFSLARAISVLVISCPCALGLATPVAIMVGHGVGAKNGILYKTAAAIENAGRIQIVALDKTGTITVGKPQVTDVLPVNGISDTQLLTYAYSLEKKSEHPLARAIIAKAEELNLSFLENQDFAIAVGNGLECVVEGSTIVGGNREFIVETKQIIIPTEVESQARELAEQGKTPLYFAKDKSLLGLVAVADVMKTDSTSAIHELQNMGIRVVMLTGDNKETATSIGKEVGVDEIIAGVRPDGKEKVITELKNHGKVAMVGDGINDAPALTAADVGIAIGAGSDIAIDAADVVLIKSSLSDVAAAVRLGRATLKNIYENLFWAFIYNLCGIPLAAGAFIALFGWKLNPMFGAAAMSLSSFCVVTNALRLNLLNVNKSKSISGGEQRLDTSDYDRNMITQQEDKEMKKMEKTLKVEGMMCGHCEAHVKKALEALEQVDQAVASHEKGEVIITLNADIDEAILKQTIEAEGYSCK